MTKKGRVVFAYEAKKFENYIPEWAKQYQIVSTKNLKTRIMNTKQQIAAVKAQQKEQQRLSEISLRNDCLRMALEYHRGVQNKNGWEIDLSAVEEINLTKGKKKITPQDVINIFFDTGRILYRSRDVAGNRLTSRAINRTEHPGEVTLEMVLKTANRFFIYISQNKQK